MVAPDPLTPSPMHSAPARKNPFEDVEFSAVSIKSYALQKTFKVCVGDVVGEVGGLELGPGRVYPTPTSTCDVLLAVGVSLLGCDWGGGGRGARLGSARRVPLPQMLLLLLKYCCCHRGLFSLLLLP